MTAVGCEGHFTALVPVDGYSPHVTLVDETGAYLPLPYSGLEKDGQDVR